MGRGRICIRRAAQWFVKKHGKDMSTLYSSSGELSKRIFIITGYRIFGCAEEGIVFRTSFLPSLPSSADDFVLILFGDAERMEQQFAITFFWFS